MLSTVQCPVHVNVRTAGGFEVLQHTKWCTSATMLTTAKDCSSAKAVLDPGANAIKTEHNAAAPKGCSRHKGTWYFNTHATGKFDGISEPVCNTAIGK